MEISRRRLVQGGAGGAALLLALGAGRWLGGGYALEEGELGLALDTAELCVARALIQTLAPAEADMPGGLALGVLVRADEEVWAAAPGVAESLKQALLLIEYLPLTMGFWARFTRLDAADRLAAVGAMLRHRRRPVVQAISGWKQIILLHSYAHPDAWAGIGYRGPWVRTPAPPASRLRYEALREAALAAR